MANLTTTDAVIIELFDNPLTENPDDRYGRVVNLASVDVDTLTARAIAGGYNGNAASMKAAYEALKQEATKAVVRGEIVNFGLGHVILDVEGVFEGDEPQWNPEKHKLVASITTTKELRETLKVTPVNIRGMASNHAAIRSVTDVTTKKVNEVLTPAGMANISGSRIKIDGDNPDVGLFLVNQDTQERNQVPDTTIGLNDPSKVMFIVPAGLAAGDYLVSIITQYSAHSKQTLNEPRTITFNHVSKVE
jgi:hypothetical protein